MSLFGPRLVARPVTADRPTNGRSHAERERSTVTSPPVDLVSVLIASRRVPYGTLPAHAIKCKRSLFISPEPHDTARTMRVPLAGTGSHDKPAYIWQVHEARAGRVAPIRI